MRSAASRARTAADRRRGTVGPPQGVWLSVRGWSLLTDFAGSGDPGGRDLPAVHGPVVDQEQPGLGGSAVTERTCGVSGMPSTPWGWTTSTGRRTAVTGGSCLPPNRCSGSSPMADRSWHPPTASSCRSTTAGSITKRDAHSWPWCPMSWVSGRACVTAIAAHHLILALRRVRRPGAPAGRLDAGRRRRGGEGGAAKGRVWQPGQLDPAASPRASDGQPGPVCGPWHPDGVLALPGMAWRRQAASDQGGWTSQRGRARRTAARDDVRRGSLTIVGLQPSPGGLHDCWCSGAGVAIRRGGHAGDHLAGGATTLHASAESVLLWPVLAAAGMSAESVGDILDAGVAAAAVLSRDVLHAPASVLLGVAVLVIA